MDIYYLDAHLHLTEQTLTAQNSLMHQANTLGFRSFWINTAQPCEWQFLENFSCNHQEIFPFFGVHPWFVGILDNNWANILHNLLRKMMEQCKVGIGEIGLDKKCISPASLQEKIFIQQIEIAQKLHIPVTIHCLERWGRIVDILQHLQPSIPLIFHSYNGSYEIMRRLMEHHSLFSFNCKAMERPKQRELLKKVPLQHILLETDLCHPVQKGAETEAHKDLICFYEKVAQLRGISLIEFAYQVGENGEI